MIDIYTCRAQGHTVTPTALLMGQMPGMMCAECNGWSSLTRREFRMAFMKSFATFLQEIGVTNYRRGSVKMTQGSFGIVMQGRGNGTPRGSAADRRKIRRRMEAATI